MKRFLLFSCLAVLTLLTSCQAPEDASPAPLTGEWKISDMAYSYTYNSPQLGSTTTRYETEAGDFGTVEFFDDQAGALTFDQPLFTELSESSDTPYVTSFSWTEQRSGIVIATPDKGDFFWLINERTPESVTFTWILREHLSAGFEEITYTFTVARL